MRRAKEKLGGIASGGATKAELHRLPKPSIGAEKRGLIKLLELRRRAARE